MMKPFVQYQYLDGEANTEKSMVQKDSKFWNEGKWRNFISPLLPEDCGELTFVDMGCNAGLFLSLAEKKGFDRVVGIDASVKAVERGLKHCDRIDGKYDIQCRHINRSLKHLPMMDYVVFVNVHYYVHVADWLNFLDTLQSRTQYCIIVTDRKVERHAVTSSHPVLIKRYFKNWKLIKRAKPIPTDGDPHPRKYLESFCFESPVIKRVPISKLSYGRHTIKDYYVEVEKGVKSIDTRYYQRLRKDRHKNWPEEKTLRFLDEKARLYEDIKNNGLQNPIIINSVYRVQDGNHRIDALKQLGYKSILARVV